MITYLKWRVLNLREEGWLRAGISRSSCRVRAGTTLADDVILAPQIGTGYYSIGLEECHIHWLL